MSAADNIEGVYRRVRTAILDGEIAPGAVMSRVALADSLGVSRTPLREALRMLQGEGLVDAALNKSVSIRPLSATDCEELAVMRIALEREAVRIAVPRLSPDDIAGLAARLAEMAHFASLDDYDRWQAPHRSFHRGLTAPAGERINSVLDLLFDHAERYRRLHIGHAPRPWATASHEAILAACRAGDKEQTADLLAEHLARTAVEIIELLEHGFQPTRLEQALHDRRRREEPPGS